jgi:hypothetical protein
VHGAAAFPQVKGALLRQLEFVTVVAPVKRVSSAILESTKVKLMLPVARADERAALSETIAGPNYASKMFFGTKSRRCGGNKQSKIEHALMG